MKTEDLEDKLGSVFQIIFEREFDGPNITVEEVEEWDSLTHIKLIMTLELEFKISIDPDSIPSLYSSYSVILDFLKKKMGDR